MEVELTILPDGSFLINRGTIENNKIIYDLLKDDAKDPQALQEFTSITDDTIILAGNKTFCG